jgi:hypothetical protein
MRRADIARCSVVTDGADYDFTLPDQRRGVGVLWRSQIAPNSELSHHLGPKASVVTGSLIGSSVVPGLRFRGLPTALPNYGDVLETLPGLGFTVISRCVAGISADPPQMLRCQTLPSMWTLGKDEPVIPGVPFIR